MNSEKVISNIKKAIKEHLDNNYSYDMLVDFELDVIDWNSLFEYIDKLQQENQELKKQLEEAQENIILLKASKPMLEYKKALEETQQKEFIDYLEKIIIDSKAGSGQQYYYQQVLEMYKEIIGGIE